MICHDSGLKDLITTSFIDYLPLTSIGWLLDTNCSNGRVIDCFYTIQTPVNKLLQPMDNVEWLSFLRSSSCSIHSSTPSNFPSVKFSMWFHTNHLTCPRCEERVSRNRTAGIFRLLRVGVLIRYLAWASQFHPGLIDVVINENMVVGWQGIVGSWPQNQPNFDSHSFTNGSVSSSLILLADFNIKRHQYIH